MLLRAAAIAVSVVGLGCSGSQRAAVVENVAEAAPDAADGDASAEPAPSEDAESDAPDTTDVLVVLPAQFTQEAMPMRMLGDGDPVDLWNAPQGGHVVLFGAKVRNMTSEVANLKVRFRRPDTGLIVAEEGRSVKMVPVPGEPGTLQPDIRSFSQVANVPLCPSYMDLGIVDEPFDVEVMVTALYTQPVQTGLAKVKVIARCSTPSDEAFCRCDCGPEYFLGKCSEVDDAGQDSQVPREASPPDAAEDANPD